MLLLLAACSDQSVGKFNGEPAAEILSHKDGDGVTEAATVTMSGAASDPDDGATSLIATWSVNGEEVCSGAPGSEGATACDIVVPKGSAEVLLEVRDPGGAAASAKVTLDVIPLESPEVEILSPASGDHGYSDTALALVGSAYDPDTASADLRYTWTSSLDGELATGNATTDGAIDDLVFLSEGNHTLTLLVEDPQGYADDAQIALSIGGPNTAPTCAVLAPSAGTYAADSELLLTGNVADADESADALLVVWSSDQDGELFRGNAATDGTTDVSALLTPGTHVLSLAATDELGLSCSDTVVVTINTAPTAPTVTISPPSPTTGDVLTATATGATDTDGDTLTMHYAWSVDGVDAALTEMSVPADRTTRGETWMVTAWADDGLADGPTATASVVIGNTAPSATAPTITPSPASASDTLTCTPGTFSDADGDADASTLTWTVNGSLAGTGDTLTSGYVRGDLVTCTVSPFDGTDHGPDVSASLTIDNSAPTADGVSITPAAPTAEDTLTATATGTDLDGDSVSFRYAWYVEGSLAGSSATLTGAFQKGDEVYVVATPTDGTDDGLPLTSASVTIGNTPPEAPRITITPASPVEGDDLLCTVTSPSDDIDGDTVTYTMAWTRDGMAEAGSESVWPGDSASGTLSGEVWVCTATPDDGDDEGPAATATVTIGETAIDYTGGWTLDRTIKYSCAFGLVSINFSTMTVTDDNPLISVRVSGNPGTLSGAFSTATNFDADNVLPGTCTETYTMSGTFTGEDSFSGTFEASYSGSCFDCTDGSWIFNATR